jgi:hypothetical protein
MRPEEGQAGEEVDTRRLQAHTDPGGSPWRAHTLHPDPVSVRRWPRPMEGVTADLGRPGLTSTLCGPRCRWSGLRSSPMGAGAPHSRRAPQPAAVDGRRRLCRTPGAHVRVRPRGVHRAAQGRLPPLPGAGGVPGLRAGRRQPSGCVGSDEHAGAARRAQCLPTCPRNVRGTPRNSRSQQQQRAGKSAGQEAYEQVSAPPLPVPAQLAERPRVWR